MTVPESSNRKDWPRLVARQVNANARNVNELRQATDWSALGSYADDAAAAAGGVEVGELYLKSGSLTVRLT